MIQIKKPHENRIFRPVLQKGRKSNLNGQIKKYNK